MGLSVPGSVGSPVRWNCGGYEVLRSAVQNPGVTITDLYRNPHLTLKQTFKQTFSHLTSLHSSQQTTIGIDLSKSSLFA